MIPDNYFWRQLRFYRQAMSPAQRRRTRRRKPKGIQYPRGLEKQYAKFISNTVRDFSFVVLKKLQPYVLKYVRNDDASTELESILTELEQELEVYFGGTYIATNNIGQIIQSFAEKIFGKHSAFFQEEVSVLTGGQSIPMDYSWWSEAETFWRQENFRLIKSLNQEYINRLNDLVIQSVQGNMPYETLLSELEKLTDNLSGYRARRLARDQIGKLNGAISKYQQTSIGMETYYWHTMGDEKVRGNPSGIYARAIPQHHYIDGMLCSWNNPAVYSDDLGVTWKDKPTTWVQTHPGFSIMCRCLAYGSWNYSLSDLDAEIEEGVT